MLKSYAVELHTFEGHRPVWREEFDQFEAAYSTAKAEAARHPNHKVLFRLPATATDDERERVHSSGWERIW